MTNIFKTNNMIACGFVFFLFASNIYIIIIFFLTYILLSECYKMYTNYVDRIAKRSNSWIFFCLLIRFFYLNK